MANGMAMATPMMAAQAIEPDLAATSAPMMQAVPQTGVLGAQNIIQQGTGEALGILGGAFGQAREDIMGGGAGMEQQAALAGLLGPRAQQQAMVGFEQSPGQRYLQQEAERAVLRNAAATGGLSGGNVLRELQQQAIGMAQQDFQNQFQRGQQVLGMQQQQGQALANLAAQGGQLGAGLVGGATTQLGEQAFGAGQQLAQQAAATAGALGGLQQQLGAGISGITGQGLTNLANLASGTGQMSAQQLNQLATTLANLGVGAGTQAAQMGSLAGQFDAAALAGMGSFGQNTIQQLIDAGVFK